jgi:hypothetical protein
MPMSANCSATGESRVGGGGVRVPVLEWLRCRGGPHWAVGGRRRVAGVLEAVAVIGGWSGGGREL